MKIDDRRRYALCCLCLSLAVSLWRTCTANDSANQKEGAVETRAEFDQLVGGRWREVLRDSGMNTWREHWLLDGQQATIKNTPLGMELNAGPEFGNDAHHMVLWTRQDFAGDVKIEYEYTRLDAETRGVNILYIQATGSGSGPHTKDIARWAQRRAVPAMDMYYNHMHAYHISYAAYPNAQDAGDDYIRARRYVPDANGLRGTDLAPDYFRTGLFKTGVPHKITVIKCDQELFMHIRTDDRQMLCHWENVTLPPIVAGRIGLRHMYTRRARYRDLRISVREPAD